MKIIISLLTLAFACCLPCSAQQQSQSSYFVPAPKSASTPDAEGFIRRWTVLEPISLQLRTNATFNDSWLRERFGHEYFKGQTTIVPRDGQHVTAESEKMAEDKKTIEFIKEKLTWHSVESQNYNLKLFRFAEYYNRPHYGVLFWTVTTINCAEDMDNVRLSIGSNSASLWWIDGKEVLLMSGDRRMVADDCATSRLQLKKGKHIIRGVIINGPGMSDFCVRLTDENGKPITNGYTIE